MVGLAKGRLFVVAFLTLLFMTTISCDRTHDYRIGVSQCSDDDWRNKLNAEIQREMMFHPEAIVEIRSANDNSEQQIADIEYFIENDFDIIIAAPNEAKALTPVISKAYNSGIPVLLFDRIVEGKDFTAWQGADNEGIGRAAGNYVAKLVGTNAPVIEIEGLMSSSPAKGRHNGFHSVGLNVVGSAPGNWNYEDAETVADSLLRLYPDVKAIYAHNDRMAIAASDVARRLGLTPYIIGIDAAPEIGMKAVADSVITATFFYPTDGERLIKTAFAILNNQPFDTIVAIKASPAVDADNIGPLLHQNEVIKNETAHMEELKAQVDEYWSQHSSQTVLFYAVVIIVLLLSGLLFMVLRAFWQHRRHQAEMEAATASKLAFFTNVSHELRTPLTLISEPLDMLTASDNLNERQRLLIRLADKNVRLLKRLINQILDFRKYENNKWDVKLSENKIEDTVRLWGESFEGLARRRDIKYNVNVDLPEGFSMALDTDKMERVFYNLVSNAFKYTPDNGTITVDCRLSGDMLHLSVTDDGQGISAKDLPMVFDRFFQSDTLNPNSSGIGLALAKAIIELHGGTIQAESTLGKGSRFTVIIPVRHIENAAQPLHAKITARDVDAELSAVDYIHDADVVKEERDRPLILVVDDNADMRTMMHTLLSSKYEVITAGGGTDGLRLAAKYTPDLVISDVMMPGIDGMEFCLRMKADITTSHIPLLMVTACAMDEQRVQGYEAGADGYISKPFSASLLLTRCKNLIENRKRIKTAWKDGETILPDMSKPVKGKQVDGAPDIDSVFYKKFIETVSERMSNPELNVDELASEMGLGRSQLYRKIKSLTNYSPVELLRRLRLEKARRLLDTTEMTVSEIAYEVGFATPAYFTKCYRDTYGETPTETRAGRE